MLLIFSDVTFKIATWWPYWIFWFLHTNFSFALNINSNFSRTILVYMGRSLLIFSEVIFKWPLGCHIRFFVSGLCRMHCFWSIIQVCFRISLSIFVCMLFVAVGRSLLIFNDVTFKMDTWCPCWVYQFLDSNFSLALNIKFKLEQHITGIYG